jgi:hypothetical protein
MQMSQTTLFAFVEGKQSDPFVFGMICSSVCDAKNVSYKICKASEVANTSGGKTALLSFHDYLRRRKALKSVLGAKTTHGIFFMDKDIDDLLRRRRRSQHVIYTRHYDVQNDIFLNGRLLQAVAAAASIDPAVLTPLLADARGWCRRAAELWKDWVVLCVVAAYQHINHQCNYRVISQVQCDRTGAPDPAKVAQMKTTMLAKSGADGVTFERTFRAIERRIHRMYNEGSQDRVFKGKWYASLLDQDLFRRWGQTGYDRKGFVSKVTSALAASLRVDDPWAEGYKASVMQVLES